jgi:hypothetical protein
MTMEVQLVPRTGEKLVIVGRLLAIVKVPRFAWFEPHVTSVGPVVAPEGTVTTIWVRLVGTTVAANPLKVTEGLEQKSVP